MRIQFDRHDDCALMDSTLRDSYPIDLSLSSIAKLFLSSILAIVQCLNCVFLEFLKHLLQELFDIVMMLMYCDLLHYIAYTNPEY